MGGIGLQDLAGGWVVHVAGGVAALIAATSMVGRRGFGYAAMPPHNLTMTVTGVAATSVYTAIVSLVLFRVVSAIVTVRVDQENETAGLDIALHDERGLRPSGLAAFI